MTENTVIPLFILAITFPTVTIFPLQLIVLRKLSEIEVRLSILERK